MLTGPTMKLKQQQQNEKMPVASAQPAMVLAGRNRRGGAVRDRPREQGKVRGKFGKFPQEFPLAGALHLDSARGIEPAFANPLAHLVGGDRPILSLVGSDDSIHGCT